MGGDTNEKLFNAWQKGSMMRKYVRVWTGLVSYI